MSDIMDGNFGRNPMLDEDSLSMMGGLQQNMTKSKSLLKKFM